MKTTNQWLIEKNRADMPMIETDLWKWMDKGRGCGHAIWDRLLYMGESAGARARAGLLKPDGVTPETMKVLGLIIDHWYWVDARKAK